jgi:hypothetical protein
MTLFEPIKPDRRRPTNRFYDIVMRLVALAVPLLVLVVLIYLIGN